MTDLVVALFWIGVGAVVTLTIEHGWGWVLARAKEQRDKLKG